MWFAIGLLVISLGVSYLLQPRPEKPKAAALDEFDLPSPAEGTPQCVFFGDCWTKDWQVLAYGNLRTRPVKTKSGK